MTIKHTIHAVNIAAFIFTVILLLFLNKEIIEFNCYKERHDLKIMPEKKTRNAKTFKRYSEEYKNEGYLPKV